MNVIENFHTVRYAFDFAIVKIEKMEDKRDAIIKFDQNVPGRFRTHRVHTNKRRTQPKRRVWSKIDVEYSLFTIINDCAFHESDGSNALNTGKYNKKGKSNQINAKSRGFNYEWIGNNS